MKKITNKTIWKIIESYFGTRRVKSKHCFDDSGKTIVFEIFNHRGKVYNSYGSRGCNGLFDLVYKKHFRVNHGKNEFSRRKTYINAIESF